MNLKNGNLLLILLLLISTPVLMFSLSSGVPLLYVAPFGLILFTVTIVAFPSTILAFLLASTFVGRHVITRMTWGVTPTDLLILFVIPLMIITRSECNGISYSGLVKEKEHNSVVISYLIFILLCAISLFVNAGRVMQNSVITGIWEFYRVLQIPLVFVLFLKFFRKGVKYLNLIIGIIIFGTYFQIPVSMYQKFFGSAIAAGEVSREVHGTVADHHSVVAMFIVTVLPLTVHYIIKSVQISHRIFHGMAALGLLYVIIISESRSALLGILLAGGLYTLKYVRITRKNLSILAVLFLIALLAYQFMGLKGVIQRTISSSDTGGVDVSSLSRLLIWKGAIDSFLRADWAHKFIGHGLGMYFTIKYDFVIWASRNWINGAHNNFLHALNEVGILGTTTILAHFGFILKVLWNKRKSIVAEMFMYATIALLVSGITQETFWFQKAFLNYWVFYIVVFAVVLEIARNEEKGIS